MEKVDVIDGYGDTYIGKFTGDYEYYGDEVIHKVSLNVATPVKQAMCILV